MAKSPVPRLFTPRFAPERLVRKPVKGLRCKLRTALRAAGFAEKFTTVHMRSPDSLLVIVKGEGEVPTLPFNQFEGRPVRVARK